MGDMHDMGGRTELYGPIERDEHEFHADWERRVFGVSMVSQALDPNIDRFRHTIEELPRQTYFRSYFDRWLAALERMLVEDGFLAPGEVDARIEGRPHPGGDRRAPRLKVAVMSRALRLLARPLPPVGYRLYSRVFGFRRGSRQAPRFVVGDGVRTLPERPPGHSRLPGYATGATGTVIAHHGVMVFPDAHAQGRGEDPAHLYTVAFVAADLWDDAERDTYVHVDLFEPYLEPA